MKIKYRGKIYVNFIVHYQDGEPIKYELFNQGDHYSSEPRHSVHTGFNQIEIIYS